jgi:hypothetical protein
MWGFAFLVNQLILAGCEVGKLQYSLSVTAVALVVVVVVFVLANTT